MGISWTADGTQLAAAGGNGAVFFGQVVDVSAEDGRVRVNLENGHKIIVQVWTVDWCGHRYAWVLWQGFESLAPPLF